MRLKKPAATALIFSTGRVVLSGTKSLYDCNKAGRKIARILQKKYPLAKYKDVLIQNIVGSAFLNRKLCLSEIVMKNPSLGLTFEPELFPGMIFQSHLDNVKILIFQSSKFVITGCKNAKIMDDAYLNLIRKMIID
jgi:transcription initiation factor TFIID TATA-box-binding protein